MQPQEGIEEDLEEVVFEDDEAEEQPQLYDRVLLEVDADGDIVIPPVVGEAPKLDVAEEEEPVQDAAGNDPDDSGDDSSSSEDSSSEEEDENEDEDENDEDVDIEGLEDNNSGIANNGNNNDNQDGGNNNDNENGDEQGDDHRYRRAEYHEHTYVGPDGLFCIGGAAVGHKDFSEAFVHHQALCGAWNEGLLHYGGSCPSDHGTGRQMEDSYDSSYYSTLRFRGCLHQRCC
jgi:hypothetical protein